MGRSEFWRRECAWEREVARVEVSVPEARKPRPPGGVNYLLRKEFRGDRDRGIYCGSREGNDGALMWAGGR